MKLSHTNILAARCAALLIAACAPWGATAADGGGGGVWRCGNVYTDTPCQGGRRVEADDTRSPDQKRNADEATRDARASAIRMEKDRLRLEAAGARNRAVVIDGARRPDADRPAAKAQKTRKVRKDVLYVDPDSLPKKKSKKKSRE
jgi:hypothetical protein